MAFQASAVRQSRCVTSHMCRGQRHRSGDGGGDAGGGTCRARFHHVRRGVRAHGHLRRLRAGLLLAIAHGRGRVAARGRARGACPERECGCTRPRSGRLPRTTPAAVRRRQAVSEGWQDYAPLLDASVFSHVTGPWLFGTACTACSSPVLVPAVWRGVVRGFAWKVLSQPSPICASRCSHDISLMDPRRSGLTTRHHPSGRRVAVWAIWPRLSGPCTDHQTLRAPDTPVPCPSSPRLV